MQRFYFFHTLGGTAVVQLPLGQSPEDKKIVDAMILIAAKLAF